MALNMKTLTQALAKTAAVIEKKVQTTVQEVTGPKPLQDYELIDQIGSAGPGLAWKLYSAKARGGSSLSQQYPTVCLWLLDKRALSEARTRAGLSKAAEDSFFDIIRADAAKLVRLRHPGVVHVVQALDETKNAMAMVTEPLFASVANVLGHLDNIEKVPKELKGIEMGLLEVKHGLLQIAESLDFLHNNARLVHRAISPETVLITSNGAWKLGGFGFAVSADQASADMANVSNFHYAEYDVDDDVLPLQPSLNYTAPELVRTKSATAEYYSDVFSFACVAYHLIARKPLFDCHNNVKMYMNNLTYLSSAAFSSIPPELVLDLRKMLSANEASRPTALDFTGSNFFRDDTRLRALRFLDHMLGRDNMQKSEFLKALADMWKDFDGRVLRYKVLPPLCAELRNMVMQPMILPMVLTIAEAQDKNDFAQSTMPALVPVLSNAAGETLLLLVKQAELIINKTSPEDLVLHVLPMFVRAYDDTDNRMQEEALKKTVKLAKQLDVQLVEKEILHRVHGLALRTTVAAVRVNSLVCLADMVHMLDKHAVLEILHTIRRCTAVDQSAPTLMCTLGVANSILKQFGVEFAAEHVLPLLAPLLIAQQLNVQQFAKYMFFVKDILRKIEENRGVTVTDSGIPEVRPSLAGTVHQSEPVKKANISIQSNSSSPAWDEDWTTARGPTTSGQASTTTISSPQPALANVNQPIKVGSSNSLSAMISAASGQQTSASCPAIDIEWPPKSSYAGSLQLGDSEIHNPNSVASNANLNDLDHHNPNSFASNANLNDLDPFADWPPRPSGSLNASRSSNNGAIGPPVNKYQSGSIGSMQNGLSFQANNSSGWAFDSPSSIDPTRQSRASPIRSVNSGLNPQNSLGYLKHNQGISAASTQKATDLESIFVSAKSEQTAPRLAPPPSSTVGGGRGRGRGRGINQGQLGAPPASSMYAKSQSEQPPLLDLL